MRTILIVDDQPSVLAALAYLFNLSGYGVVVAANGAEALAVAENQAFDVALIDYHMPGMDGTAVCRALGERARRLGPVPPLWMMTAAYTSEAAAKSLEAGARALLKKPFDCAELLREIAGCLDGPAAAAIAPLAGGDDDGGKPLEHRAVA